MNILVSIIMTDLAYGPYHTLYLSNPPGPLGASMSEPASRNKRAKDRCMKIK